jgi:hypothetical protein
MSSASCAIAYLFGVTLRERRKIARGLHPIAGLVRIPNGDR